MHLFVAVLFLVWAIGLFIFHTSRQRVLRMRRISDPNKPLPPPPSSSSLKLKKIKKTKHDGAFGAAMDAADGSGLWI
ncbi:hypothetical protein GTA08_BOTSDO08505 [Botryosphaeria dothidea]|uniref:Uncharacterized protein n=1 Tax=Botryosphaeria dothidea TaxID=55169 RepID=A0A8H4IN11_9PEZI|nr:hypothetical protein GTA08_BOTSDO08505 [Botryosphaeria dothidea]